MMKQETTQMGMKQSLSQMAMSWRVVCVLLMLGMAVLSSMMAF